MAKSRAGRVLTGDSTGHVNVPDSAPPEAGSYRWSGKDDVRAPGLAKPGVKSMEGGKLEPSNKGVRIKGA